MRTIPLKVTSAFMLAGQIARAGDVVEVDETTAKDLMHRGKAVLAVAGQAKQEPKTLAAGGVEADEGATSEAAGAMSEAGPATSEAAGDTSEAAEPQPKRKGKK